ncbi:MAG TPA: NAD(P)/FAD-dependent oxidoreductase [Verrucomicrobiae bacterium]|nr:NAD(P)/FAD-dependent oxidoreductase [Verrucomicrobiae bacterium]
MDSTLYDAIIIGGGPGGSSTASFLGRAGRRALVLEKEHFPRFHIGESLLPYNQMLFREMGVLPAVEAAGFPRKVGAQFHIGNGSKALKLVFRNGAWTRETSTFQVERAKLDHILLKHAAACGAEVREGWTVTKYSNDSSGVCVSARSDKGETATFRGSFLVDASGRGNLTGNNEGMRIIHNGLKKIAIFGHFEKVKLDPGEPAGDTVIVRLEDKWVWIIPVSPTKTSVGVVMDQEDFASARKTPAEVFHHTLGLSAILQERMQEAKQLGNIETTSDFSYHNRQFVGPRLIRVGDAAGFMDPIFSAGVYLATYSGKMAAGIIDKALARNSDGRAMLAKYEKDFFRAMKFYWDMVEAYYTTPFMELFVQPRGRYRIPDAIVALLAGELNGGWKIAWRLRMFYLLVKIQRYWPLVPRVSFSNTVPRRAA